MQSSTIINNLFNNPFKFTYFNDVIIRLLLLMVTGFILVLLLNIKNIKNTFKSSAFKKLIGWIIMAPAFLISIIVGGIPAIFLISYIVYKCAKEFTNIFTLTKFYLYILLGIWFFSLSFILGTMFKYNFDTAKQIVNILPIIYLLLISLISIIRGRIENIMARVSYTFFASIWICYSMLHFILLSKTQYGKEILIIIGFSVALSDIFAFLAGQIFIKIKFGIKHKIAENISPNKTYAGIIGNIIGAFTGVFVFNFLLPDTGNIILISLIILIGISSSFGDLLESLVKRSAGIKDASNAIFGHGGFLDRVDSLLIVIITVYYFLSFFTGYIS